MATAKERSTKSTPIVSTLFRLFSVVFDRFCTFSLVFALFELSVSDRFRPSVFALFRTIRLLPFSGSHWDSPELLFEQGQNSSCRLPSCADLPAWDVCTHTQKHWCEPPTSFLSRLCHQHLIAEEVSICLASIDTEMADRVEPSESAP